VFSSCKARVFVYIMAVSGLLSLFLRFLSLHHNSVRHISSLLDAVISQMFFVSLNFKFVFSGV